MAVLNTGNADLNRALGGGLAPGKTSVWIAKHGDRKTSHLLDLLMGAIFSNRPPTGEVHLAMFITPEMGIAAYVDMLYARWAALHTGMEEDVSRLEKHATLLAGFAEYGWTVEFISVYKWHTLTADLLKQYIDQIQQMTAGKLQLVLIDGLEQSAPKNPQGHFNLQELLDWRQVSIDGSFHLATTAVLVMPPAATRITKTGTSAAKFLASPEVSKYYDREIQRLTGHCFLMRYVRTDEPSEQTMVIQPITHDLPTSGFTLPLMGTDQISGNLMYAIDAAP